MTAANPTRRQKEVARLEAYIRQNRGILTVAFDRGEHKMAKLAKK